MVRRARKPKTAVVDTNVILAANEQQPEVRLECVERCIQELLDLRRSGTVVIDDAGRILSEYMRKTKPWTSQKTGDAFVKWLSDNRLNKDRCEQVSLTPMPGDDQDFHEFPRDPRLASFDRSDRVFVATCLAHPRHPHLLEACDTDFYEFRDALERAGLEIEFLCPEDIRHLYERRRHSAPGDSD